MQRPPPRSTRNYPLFPYTTLFRSASVVFAINGNRAKLQMRERHYDQALALLRPIGDPDHEIESSPSPYTLSDEITLARALIGLHRDREARALLMPMRAEDRKSTRLNSSQ